MHDFIYENQKRLNLQLLFESSEGLNLPVEELKLALDNRTFLPNIRKDFLGGVKSGVNGTPTFYINDQKYNGPYEYEDLVAAIDLGRVK